MVRVVDALWFHQIYLEKLSKRTGCKIYGKAEFQNPGGSVKDRAALGIIKDAEASGRSVFHDLCATSP